MLPIIPKGIPKLTLPSSILLACPKPVAEALHLLHGTGGAGSTSYGSAEDDVNMLANPARLPAAKFLLQGRLLLSQKILQPAVRA